VPRKAVGSTGAPLRVARKAAPGRGVKSWALSREFGPSVIPVCIPVRVCCRKVSSTLPSGMIPMTLPWASQSRARWMAVRSGCPRQTGMMP